MLSVKRTLIRGKSESAKKAKLFDTDTRSSVVTKLNDLEWKEIALPEGFRDAEGFFGLEEIDHVKVIRDPQGSVGYQLESTNESKVSKKPRLEGSPSMSEWEGFDDRKISKQDAQPEQEELLRREKYLKPQSNSKQDKISEDISKENPKQISKKKVLKNSQQTSKQTSKQKSKTSVKSAELECFPSSGDSDAFKILESISNEEVDVSAWSSLGLSTITLSALANLGFSHPTPIQLSAIPEVLSGHDVVGKAATGSGKTLAFAIPILEHYLLAHTNSSVKQKQNQQRRDPLAMILAPTRELAHQITAHLEALFSNTGDDAPRVATITGGLSVQKQQRVLAHSDILVGTPGRLWEVMNGSSDLLTWLQRVQFLILDEADRLLSDGHYQELTDILRCLEQEDHDSSDIDLQVRAPNSTTTESNTTESNTTASKTKSTRQTLVFSATFQPDLQQKLAGKSRASRQDSMEYLLKKLNFRQKPKYINANPTSQMAANLREGLVECAGLEKDLYLYAVLWHYPKSRALIFANSIASVQRLGPLLQNLGIEAHALHSQMSQKARLRAVERFASPSKPNSILVATDVAARGLDIPSVELVLHYHLPRTADMYIHRSGRTARRSEAGSSIVLCAPEEAQALRRLVAKVHARNQSSEKSNFLRTLDLNRQIVSRLKERVTLSKNIADAVMAKEKGSSEDAWLRDAAMELGVDFDESTVPARGSGRGQGRLEARKKARALSKYDLETMRKQLTELLGQKVNAGVSVRYLSASGIDVDALLQNTGNADLLGHVEDLSL